MAFREKSAWGMALLWLAVGLFYIVQMRPWQWTMHSIDAPMGPLFIATGFIILGSVIVQAALAVRSPADAVAPADEREQRILDKASAWSGWVLAFLSVTSMLHYLQHGHGDLLFHTLFLSLLLAELSAQAFRITLFRRGV